MKSIFEYVDYRQYLKDQFDARKSADRRFSYREFAEAIQIDTSNLHKLLNGRMHLPARCHSFALSYLDLSGRSAEYFILLTAYARERSSGGKTEILDRALALREVACRQIEESHLEQYFGDWWVSAVRSLLEVNDGRAVPSEISGRLIPKVDEQQVSRALDVLLALGMVRKGSSDRLVPVEAHVTASGEIKTRAVRRYQERILGLASESVHRFGPEQRDISTITMSVDGRAASRIQEALKECRRQVQIEVDEAKRPDRVMQLCMAFFPLAPQTGMNS
jgi:uncharacterized protein (TIGR02147 family)